MDDNNDDQADYGGNYDYDDYQSNDYEPTQRNATGGFTMSDNRANQPKPKQSS